MARAPLRWVLPLVGAIGLIASALAGATIWLLLTDPVAVSTATSNADAGLFVRTLGVVILQSIWTLAGYL